jgi:hypothetical protein
MYFWDAATVSYWLLIQQISPTFHGTQWFTTVFTTAHHLSLSSATLIQPTYSHPTSLRSLFLSCPCLDPQMVSFLKVLLSKPCIHWFLLHKWHMPHPFYSPWMWSPKHLLDCTYHEAPLHAIFSSFLLLAASYDQISFRHPNIKHPDPVFIPLMWNSKFHSPTKHHAHL